MLENKILSSEQKQEKWKIIKRIIFSFFANFAWTISATLILISFENFVLFKIYYFKVDNVILKNLKMKAFQSKPFFQNFFFWFYNLLISKHLEKRILSKLQYFLQHSALNWTHFPIAGHYT